MFSARLGPALRTIAAAALVLVALPTQAADQRPVRWHLVGMVSGLANPTTTEAYFPRPLSSGELVDITVTIDPSVPGSVQTAYARYDGAITSALVSGSDWKVNFRAPLAVGTIAVTDDHPDYGDSLGLVATSSARPGKTWFDVEVFYSNPGGPSPGTGPWQPFTSLALPKTPPAIGSFPSAYFYFIARRDVAGQQPDGGAYFGQILSIEQVTCH